MFDCSWQCAVFMLMFVLVSVHRLYMTDNGLDGPPLFLARQWLTCQQAQRGTHDAFCAGLCALSWLCYKCRWQDCHTFWQSMCCCCKAQLRSERGTSIFAMSAAFLWCSLLLFGRFCPLSTVCCAILLRMRPSFKKCPECRKFCGVRCHQITNRDERESSVSL